MLSVHQGDRLPPLADHLFDVMVSTPLGPLEAEVLVVAQNTGLRGWLENALARRAGCAAAGLFLLRQIVSLITVHDKSRVSLKERV